MRVQARWPVACARIGRNGIAGEAFPAETLNLSAAAARLAITRFVMHEARDRGQLARAVDPGTSRWWLPAA